MSLKRISSQENDKYAFTEELIQDYVNQWTLMNDFIDPIPRIEIVYNDMGNFQIAKFYNDAYTLLYLNMLSPELTQIEHYFIVDSIEILDRSIQKTTYKIKARSMSSICLDSNTTYSSKIEKSITQIIEDMMQQTHYPYKKDPNKIHSDKKLFYISPTSMSLKDQMEWLLRYAASSTTGPYYLIYNLKTNKGDLMSFKNVFQVEMKDIPSDYNMVMVSEVGANPASVCGLNQIRSSQILDSNFYNSSSAKLTLNNFNYNDRKWSKDIYEYKRTLKYLPNAPKEDFVKFKHYMKTMNKYSSIRMKSYDEEYTTLSQGKVHDRIDQIFNYTDMIQFSCTGYLKRDVGEIINISGGLDKDIYRYNGMWMITRVYHKFTRSQYVTDITVVRHYMSKNPDDELVSEQQ